MEKNALFSFLKMVRDSERGSDDMDWEAEPNGVVIVQPPVAGAVSVQFGRPDSLEEAQIVVLQPPHPEP